jgi:aminopeptidase N
MEKVAKKDFKAMAKTWLKKTGFPVVEIKSKHFRKTLTLTLKQKTKNTWQLPFIAALCDKEGKEIVSKLVWVKKKNEKIVFKNVKEPAFLSLNRGLSFYGKILYDASEEQLYLQAKKDKDIVNRYMAFYRLLDAEKTRLVKNPNVSVNEKVVDLYFSLISDRKLVDRMGSMLFTLFESVEDKRYAHRYQQLYEAKKKIQVALAKKYKKQLFDLYMVYSRSENLPYLEKKALDIKRRQAKNLCLGILAKLESPDVYYLVRKQFNRADNASDKFYAFTFYINSKAKDKMQMLQQYQQEARNNLVAWEMFLSAVGMNDSDDFLGIIKSVEKSPFFHIEQSNDQRALYGRFALNRKKSLQTKDGLEFFKQTIMKLAKINEYNTVNALQVFGQIDHMEERYQADIIKALLVILNSLDKDKTPSVYNTLQRIVRNSKVSLKSYLKRYGKAKF